MSQESQPPRSDNITIFETEDGRTRVEVRFDHENVWLTQKLMADLYECSADNISLHLKNIFADRELDESAVTEESSVAAADGKKYSTRLYSLEAIIAVGYRVQSPRATQFRTWATNRLKDYILKGFAIDSERFKHGSRFDRRYFEELLEEVREIRASERMVYQKITDIYATAAANGKRVQALTEAKNHALVLRDCKLERTAQGIINAFCGCAGERCMALTVVVVENVIADKLVARLKELAAEINLGPAYEKSTGMGPVVNAGHQKFVLDWIETGIKEGAELVLDVRKPEVPAGCENGFFIGPTILDRVTETMSVGR